MVSLVDLNPWKRAARIYAGLGWLVVPLHAVRNGRCTCGNPDCRTSAGKHPRNAEWQQAATADAGTVERWWSEMPDGNVGIRTGSGSGIIAVDVDPPHGEEFLQVLSAGDLPETVEMRTGKGRRLLYAIPDSLEEEPRTRCFQDAEGKESIRLQGGGKGAQFVSPPSIHYSGAVYEWRRGHSPEDREPAPMPGWCLAEMCRPVKPAWADRPSDQREGEQDTPWTEFNRRDSWSAWLGDWGYKPAGCRTSVRYYTRPGKTGGASVSVGHYTSRDGTPALYTFSGNCPDLPGGKCYDLFGAYARVEHGGDFAAAARYLLTIGYGKPRLVSQENRIRRLEQEVQRLVDQVRVLTNEAQNG